MGKRERLPRTVLLLGTVSLFTDISSDMIFPLLPAFLAARVPNAAMLLGAMEGVADLVAAVFKLLAGRWADQAVRLKPLVVFGYTLAGVMRPLMAFATAPWHPVVIRAADRVGKGIRSAPRDALLAGSVDPAMRGRAFGFHRGMDHAGAAVGALLAAGLVALGIAVEQVFLLAAVPAAAGVIALLLVREPERPQQQRDVVESADRSDAQPSSKKKAAPRNLTPMPRRLWAYLLPVALFSLANSTDAFLLLKLSELGAAASLLPLAWLMLHVVKSAMSFVGGWAADRYGHAKVVMLGWVLYSLSYVALAWATTVAIAFVIIAFYGLYHALAEGAEKALLASLTPDESRGRAFGLYHALQGVSALVAGLGFGALWSRFGSVVAFTVASVVAGLSAALLVVLLPFAKAPAQGVR